MGRIIQLSLAAALFLAPFADGAERFRSRPGPRKQALEHYLKGLAELEKEQYSSAIEHLETATQLEFGWSRAFAELGHAYYSRAFSPVGPSDRKDAARAIDVFETALAIDATAIGNAYRLYNELALCYQMLGKKEKAFQAMKRAAMKAADNPMPAALAAQLSYELGRPEESIELLKDSLGRAKQLGTYAHVSAMIRTDKRFTMVRSPRHMALAGGTVVASRPMVSAEERLELRDAVAPVATSTARKAVVDAPKKPADPQKLQLAKVEFGLGHYRDALDVYQQILKGKDLDQPTRSMILEKAGSCYRELGLLREAVETLGEAAVHEPGRASIYYELALTYSLAGRFPKALEALRVSMGRAKNTAELKHFVMSARTDTELDALRDHDQFQNIVQASALRTKTSF